MVANTPRPLTDDEAYEQFQYLMSHRDRGCQRASCEACSRLSGLLFLLNRGFVSELYPSWTIAQRNIESS